MRHFMLSHPFSRRAFVSSLAAAAGLAPFSRWVAALAQPAAAPALRIRPEASSPEGKRMLDVYRQAVGLMQEKFPMHHPHSWRFQANTHKYPPGEPIAQIFTAVAGENTATVALHRKFALGTESGGNPGGDRIWRTCPHHDPQFVPWHRLYVAFFEQIVEKVADKPFALPYWGYLDKNRRVLPDPFRWETVAGRLNPLFFRARNSQFLAEGLREDLIAGLSQSGTEAILKSTSLLGNPRRIGFSDALEGDLHDVIHGAVGTSAGMGNPQMAARDPIFWLHHASMDHIWESWREPAGDGSSPRDPASSSNWYNPKYAFMNANVERIAGNGAKFALQAAGNLRYSYDELLPVPSIAVAAGPGAPSGPPTRVHEGTVTGSKIQRAGDSVTIALRPSVNEGVALGLSTNPSTRYDLVLTLHTASAPGTYQVYLKAAPAGGGAQSELLVGAFGLFTVDATHVHDETTGPADITRHFDVTAKVREGAVDPLRPGNVLIRASYLDEPVDITVKGAEIVAK